LSFNEDQLHQLFAESFVSRPDLLGPGDDCAILMNPPAGFCISVDQLIEGVHFTESASFSQIAGKLLGRSLSDLAAAGAEPYACTLTCAFPQRFSCQQSAELCKEIIRVAASYNLPIVGGDCSEAPQLLLTCTVMGKTSTSVPGRGGASHGEKIFVSRPLGGAVQSGRHLCPNPELVLGQYLTQHYEPSAMIDLSDGLHNDLLRILRASGVGAKIFTDRIPLSAGCDWQQAVCEGEDYGLLIVLTPKKSSRMLEDDFFEQHPLFCIGEIVDGVQLQYYLDDCEVQLHDKPFSY